MAIVHIINDITMTGYTITTLCRRCCMVRTLGMTDGTISYHNKAGNATGVIFRVTAQAAVKIIRDTITVYIRIGDNRTGGNGLAIEHMVTVRNASRVAYPAVSLF